MMDNLLSKSNEELIELFRNAIIESKSDPEYKLRLEEYYLKIENDFNEEWSRKHFKWFFTKRRQKKLHREIELRYPGPVFWIIEDMIDETLPKTTNEFFGKIVDVKEN